jgi:hypothetical protein
MSSSFVKGFRSARGFNSAICRQAATPIAARQPSTAAAEPEPVAKWAADGTAIQRIRGPDAQARQAGGRAQIIPFRMCRQAAATDSGPRAPNGDYQQRYSRHARLLSDWDLRAWVPPGLL